MDLRDWVWRSECPLSLSQAAVWAALAAFRQRDKPEQLVFPSLEEIAAAAKVSKRTVMRALSDLERLELIEIFRRTKKGSRRDEVNRYRVKVPRSQPVDLAARVAGLQVAKKVDQVSMSTAVESQDHSAAGVGFPPAGVGFSTDQVTQRDRPGDTDPPDQVSMSTRNPCQESLPRESITVNAQSASTTSADPFGILTASDPEIESPSSADDAAAPRADDGDGGGSVVEAGEGSSVVDAIRDVGEPSERQLAFMRDLYVMAYGQAPDWKVTGYMRRLDQAGVSRYVRELYAVIPGRTGYYDGPQLGDEAYELLSPRGKQWADAALDPDDLEAIFAIGPGEASS